MITPTRDRWSLLTYKAQQRVHAQQEALLAMQAKLDQVKSSEARLRQMLQEYQVQHADHSAQAHLVADALNRRQFMAQLTQLLDRSLQQVSAVQVQLAQARQNLLAAQLELSKCEKLEAHARAQERVQAQRREQRALDELAIVRHQWRQV